jgi:PST family polysaccharide transporter
VKLLSPEEKASAGGVFLIGRQLLGMVLSLISVIVVTRMLGPREYGLFAIVSGIAGYASEVGKLGLDVYLIRHQGDLEQRQIGVTQTLYLIVGLVISLAIVIIAPFLAEWYNESYLLHIFQAYSVIIPITMFAAVPTALLDRRLEFRQVVTAEFAGQLAYVTVAVPLIWQFSSIWGLVAGALVQSMLVLLLMSHWSKMRPRPCWNWQEAKAQLRYGCGYSASVWVWQGRNLVNPLLVGKLLGTEAVAYVALAMRLTAMLGFAHGAVWRIYMALLARVAHDRERMKEALETGLTCQVMIIGVVFIIFTGVSRELVIGVMGERWLPVLRIFPFIAAGMIVNSGFSLYSSALYVIGENREVTLFHIIHLALFAIAAWGFILAGRDITGYGCAELAAFASYYRIRWALRKHLFAIREGRLYSNILFVLCSLALLAYLSGSYLGLRLVTLLGALGIFLFVFPGNRAIIVSFLEKRGRLK